MEVIPGSVTSNGNGVKPPKGDGRDERAERSKRGKGKNGTERTPGKGRMDADKQPAVKKPEIVAKRLDELVELHAKAQAAGERAKEAVTKCAEDSGFLASAVNKLVRAKAGDKFEEKHREVEQQHELFDEVGS